MKGLVKLMAVGVLAVGVTACETTPQTYNDAKNMTAQGSAFDQALYDGYIQLATEEQNPYGDYKIDAKDRDTYAQRAMSAAQGVTVLPEQVGTRPIPQEVVSEVTRGRERLMDVISADGRSKAPDATARAQTMFDCWLEQLEEGYQPQDIARCRNGFYAALEQAEAAVADRPVVEAEPEPFIVFFDFDSSVITPDSARIISEAAREAQESGAVAIQVVGHADRSGPADYNRRLSLRRAEAVKQELINNGVEGSSISVEGRGESDPLVPTADGVREPQNRRVEGVWIY